MADKKIIKKSSLNELFKKARGKGYDMVAPVERGGKTVFENVTSFEETLKDYVQTVMSAKKTVFPSWETILSFKVDGKDIGIDEIAPVSVPVILFGHRPCDTKSLKTLNAVFTWEISDRFFKERMDALTLITVSCTKCDENCFCTSVGGSPGDEEGSDILLTQISDDSYLAEIFTEKGKAIVSLAPEIFGEAGDIDRTKYLADVKKYFNHADITKKLPELFESDIWLSQSLRCISCGACAYVCPACSCFDMQDETIASDGIRYRCWDSCLLPQFTLHTSGHNPRATGSQRWRQRVNHKFSFQVDRQKVLGCVGCGRCSRACPTDMNLLGHLIEINGVK